jgi:AcrR family transcriptional regulator
VGTATLYRNFSTREDLIEAVYVVEVDALCRYGDDVAQTLRPGEGLETWIRRFVAYLGTKKALLAALDRQTEAVLACKAALYASGGPLLKAAQEEGTARTDVAIDDVMRFILGVCGAPLGSEAQRDRILTMAIDGVRPR